jgi:DUF971 family protein
MGEPDGAAEPRSALERTLTRVGGDAPRAPRRARLEPVDMERDERSVVLLWNDGHRSEYACDDLRRSCPCATCRTERERSQSTAGGALRVLPADAPVHARLADVQWVGWYAFRLAWDDGHDTGIYSFEYLRSLCPCSECAAAAAPSGG